MQQPESRFAKYALNRSDQPAWNDGDAPVASDEKNLVKQRAIPLQLVKRTRKNNDESLDDTEKPTIQALPFQAKKKADKQVQLPAPNNTELYSDRPPKRSLVDFTRVEDESGTSLLIGNADFVDMEDSPGEYRNAFNRYARKSASDEVHKLQPTKPQPCAVIVYGFQDSNFSLIVDHFAKFGRILEDFNSSANGSNPLLPLIIMNQQREGIESATKRSSRKREQKTETELKNWPIFMGEGWVKITYTNPADAVRALRENDSRDDQGSVIGIVPYTRKGLEALLKQPIPDKLDIGGGLVNLQLDASEVKFPADSAGIGEVLKQSFTGAPPTTDEKEVATVDILKLKDGCKLINTTQNTLKKDKAGFIQNSAKFFFGSGDL